MNMVMYRATQNRNEPNLSFAQSLSPTMFRDNQNPNEPNLPFSQNRSSSIKFGGSTVYVPTTEQQQGTTRNGHGTEIKQNDAVWQHINKLYAIHGEQEGRITDAYKHRTSIERKVETNIAAFPDIHTKLSDLGRSVSDVSSALSSHEFGHGNGNGNGCNCDFWDIGCKAKCGIEGIIPYVLIGGLAIYAIKTRKK